MTDPNQMEHILVTLERLGSQAKRCKKLVADSEFNAQKAATLLASLREQLIATQGLEAELAELATTLNQQHSLALSEFWNAFGQACQQRGWTIHGSTDRRLLETGIFVELRKGAIVVEELGLSLPPDAQAVADAMAPHLADTKMWEQKARDFGTLIEEAYEAVPGTRERSLESVYRAALFGMQKGTFWRAPSAERITLMSRPAFRAGLTALIASGARTASGKVVRFGSSLSASDSWELFSPGEGRVVQVGRLSLE